MPTRTRRLLALPNDQRKEAGFLEPAGWKAIGDVGGSGANLFLALRFAPDEAKRLRLLLVQSINDTRILTKATPSIRPWKCSVNRQCGRARAPVEPDFEGCRVIERAGSLECRAGGVQIWPLSASKQRRFRALKTGRTAPRWRRGPQGKANGVARRCTSERTADYACSPAYRRSRRSCPGS